MVVMPRGEATGEPSIKPRCEADELAAEEALKAIPSVRAGGDAFFEIGERAGAVDPHH